MASEDPHEGSNVWEDFTAGYVPDEQLDIHPSLSLHEDYESDIDPVTYEVLRHKLFNVNEEHGRTLENVSGSPVAYYGKDFNPTILTGRGEVVVQGPYVQLFSPVAELQVQWILENRSDDPGIEPGDIYLSNDPWVGSTHQSDVFFVSPVFHDGELFCWVTNTLHQYDIGGNTSGSFCPSASDVFDEPTPIPPIKIVEGDEVRSDLRQMYLRHSRLPDLVGLDFNAQVAGIRIARERIHDVIDEYGAETVKGAMENVIDDSETKFIDQLESIPDGTWQSRAYMEGSQVGDDELYRGSIQLEKEGTTLTFRNEGTAENKNAMNLTYAGFRTAISCAINPLMMYDNMWVATGAYRHIDIETEPGTMNRAQWPSGVSAGGTMSVHLSVGLIQEVIAKMLSASEYRDDIILGPYAGVCPISQSGTDQWGNPFGTMNMDLLGSGIGARANRDGIDVGGQMHDPLGPLPNMENNEESFPILYLYRGVTADSGGPGEYRGGASMSYCWKPHKTEQIDNVFSGTGAVAPMDQGIGGYPGAGIANRIVEDSDVDAHFDEQTIPSSLADLEGTLEQLAPKSEETQLPADVIEARAGGSPGYGDPIERSPDKVERDVDDGAVSESAAYDIYGVVLDTDGDDVTVREDATVDRRDEIREERLADGSILAEGGENE